MSKLMTATAACLTSVLSLTGFGKVVGTQAPDSVRTVVFRDVPLVPGPNVIRLDARGLNAAATWARK